MAVSKRVRFEVLRRDGHRCAYCGAGPEDAKLTVDHVIPVALGGTDDPRNLTTACAPCNSGKASVPADAPIVADVDERARRWRDAVAAAAEEIQRDLDLIGQVCDLLDEHWQGYSAAGLPPLPRPYDWRVSIEMFLVRGLRPSDLVRLVDTAMATRKVPDRDVWRYFCGCAWRQLDKIQERAFQIVEEG